MVGLNKDILNFAESVTFGKGWIEHLHFIFEAVGQSLFSIDVIHYWTNTGIFYIKNNFLKWNLMFFITRAKFNVLIKQSI
jgi:hypothetical protein